MKRKHTGEPAASAVETPPEYKEPDDVAHYAALEPLYEECQIAVARTRMPHRPMLNAVLPVPGLVSLVLGYLVDSMPMDLATLSELATSLSDENAIRHVLGHLIRTGQPAHAYYVFHNVSLTRRAQNKERVYSDVVPLDVRYGLSGIETVWMSHMTQCRVPDHALDQDVEAKYYDALHASWVPTSRRVGPPVKPSVFVWQTRPSVAGFIAALRHAFLGGDTFLFLPGRRALLDAYLDFLFRERDPIVKGVHNAAAVERCARTLMRCVVTIDAADTDTFQSVFQTVHASCPSIATTVTIPTILGNLALPWMRVRLEWVCKAVGQDMSKLSQTDILNSRLIPILTPDVLPLLDMTSAMTVDGFWNGTVWEQAIRYWVKTCHVPPSEILCQPIRTINAGQISGLLALDVGFSVEDLLSLEYTKEEHAFEEFVMAGLTRVRLDEYRRRVASARPTQREARLKLEQSVSLHYMPFRNQLLGLFVRAGLFTMTCLSDFERDHFYEFLQSIVYSGLGNPGLSSLAIWLAHDAFRVGTWMGLGFGEERKRQAVGAPQIQGAVLPIQPCPYLACFALTVPNYYRPLDEIVIPPVVWWRDGCDGPPTLPSGAPCSQCLRYLDVVQPQRTALDAMFTDEVIDFDASSLF